MVERFADGLKDLQMGQKACRWIKRLKGGSKELQMGQKTCRWIRDLQMGRKTWRCIERLADGSKNLQMGQRLADGSKDLQMGQETCRFNKPSFYRVWPKCIDRYIESIEFVCIVCTGVWRHVNSYDHIMAASDAFMCFIALSHQY